MHTTGVMNMMALSAMQNIMALNLVVMKLEEVGYSNGKVRDLIAKKAVVMVGVFGVLWWAQARTGQRDVDAVG